MTESYECCDFIKKVGINMLFYRKVKGLTQAELAKRSGLATVSYAGIEHGKIISTLKTFFNIANALEISPAQLLLDREEIFLSKADIAKLYMERGV